VKHLIRNYLINLGSLVVTTKLLQGFTYEGGARTLLLGAFVFMVINWLIVPLLKIMFLPLNLLTVGLFGWVVNVLAVYFLTTAVPQFRLIPYAFPGANLGGVAIPAMDLNILQVAIIASFLIGFMSHLMHWLVS
jgi:putative membrane protein